MPKVLLVDSLVITDASSVRHEAIRAVKIEDGKGVEDV